MKFRFLIPLMMLSVLLSVPALAGDAQLPWDQTYRFSGADFEAGEGVLLTEVPEPDLGSLYLGSRVIRAGDALTAQQLSDLTFRPAGDVAGDAVISCLRLTPQGADDAAMTLKIRKNQPPAAEDSDFQTYRNIPGKVPLTASDPEGGPLSVTIVRSPRRGNAAVEPDGSVTYTPAENKVGKDSFVYTVTDDAGNVSPEATVRIEILRPSDRTVYGDMTGDPDLLAATWLREAGIFSGQIVGGSPVFDPEQTVSRGEFIAMCAAFVRDSGGAALQEGGFADQVPAWLSSHVSTGLRSGFLRGIPTDDGLMLDAGSPVTQAQAAVMMDSILGRDAGEVPVMASGSSVPSWAAAATASVEEILPISAPDAPLTRREAARLLYAAHCREEVLRAPSGLLSWAAK